MMMMELEIEIIEKMIKKRIMTKMQLQLQLMIIVMMKERKRKNRINIKFLFESEIDKF